MTMGSRDPSVTFGVLYTMHIEFLLALFLLPLKLKDVLAKPGCDVSRPVDLQSFEIQDVI